MTNDDLTTLKQPAVIMGDYMDDVIDATKSRLRRLKEEVAETEALLNRMSTHRSSLRQSITRISKIRSTTANQLRV